MKEKKKKKKKYFDKRFGVYSLYSGKQKTEGIL
jgi:hypothetical protein